MAELDDRRLRALAGQARARRQALGLSQAEVADLAGCSERFVYSLEHGKASVHLGKVLDVLGVLGLGLEVGPGSGTVTRSGTPGSQR
jgi:y4mF family transcriptional regulator